MNRSFRAGAALFCASLSLVTIPTTATLAADTTVADAVAVDAAALYASHCASCHGPKRLGAMGPALLPGNLKRLRPKAAIQVIAEGRPASQMAGFGDKLRSDEIEALEAFIRQPPSEAPHWEMADIRATHKRLVDFASLPDGPQHDADPMNLFVVVEVGDHHASIVDGDSFEVLHRFKTHFALHGGPKYSPNGRFVHFASRDGWISTFDMWSFKTIAEVRAGINTRNVAASSDGRYLMVANYLPHTLVLLDAHDLTPIRVIEVTNDKGESSRVSAVYDAAPRNSFIAALKDLPEVWEIPYTDHPLPVYNGPMHDYRMDEGVARQDGRFPVRRIALDDYLDDFFFSPDYRLLLGAARNAKGGQVVHLDLGRKIADLDLQGMPHLGSGISWDWNGRRVMATPNLKTGEVSIIDMQSFKTIKRIETLGPGFFMRSHENSPYAWVDVFFGPHKDAVHIIDKRSLEIVRTLRPEPGRTAAHVEFDKDGKHALLSIWEKDGAVLVYDSESLELVKRLPMVQPSGKYNVHNKITRSEGTSH